MRRSVILAVLAAGLLSGCARPAAAAPSPTDFAVSVTVLSKKCFGSAGCVLSYRIAPSYSGPGLDDGQEWTVTYELLGGRDVELDSFTAKGDRVRYTRGGVIRTPSSASVLSARVVRVM